MKYNFDEIIDRRNTDSVKWDRIPGNPEAIPMWVADMDFRCPKPVIDRVLEKAAFGIYAYTAVPPAGKADAITGTSGRPRSFPYPVWFPRFTPPSPRLRSRETG